jgi:thiamine biosynthesis lipoprotein
MKIILCAILLTLTLCGCAKDEYGFYRRYFIGLFDTFTEISGFAESVSEFERYTDLIYDRMADLHQLFDIFNEYEGINNLYTVNRNAGVAPVKVEREIIDLLLKAREGYELTGGVFNVMLGPVLTVWREHRELGTVPDMDKLRAAAALTGINGLVIDEANGTVFLTEAGMSLDVGAIAKAYAAEDAAFLARDAGFRSFVINSGGNVTSVGEPLDENGRWRINIQDPDASIGGIQNTLDRIYANDMTVSISGGYTRFYTVDGRMYHHIIDPSTLMPADLHKQVAVLHEDSAMADILSTALFILPVDKGTAILSKTGGEAFWIDADGVWHKTEGWD